MKTLTQFLVLYIVILLSSDTYVISIRNSLLNINSFPYWKGKFGNIGTIIQKQQSIQDEEQPKQTTSKLDPHLEKYYLPEVSSLL